MLNSKQLMNQYYNKPFHNEFADTYHNGWLQAEKDLKDNSYIEIRDSFNARTQKKPDSLNQYYYDNGYFCAICQHANDNKLI